MELSNKLGGFVAKVGFEIKKRGPEILMIVGTAGVIASTFIACKATLAASEVLDEHNKNMDEIKGREVDENYTAEDQQKDTVIQYTHTVMTISKLYAPAVILGALSIGSIAGSNHILRKRNAALAAAYATLDQGFKEYRKRVVDRFGEEVDHQLKYNIQPGEIDEMETDEKTGKTKAVKRKADMTDGEDLSGYARYFNSSNPYWSGEGGNGNRDYINMFFNARQSYLNNMLQVKKFVTLNEVYKSLGFHETKAGMVVGWRLDEQNPSGDNYIQFIVKEVFKTNEFGQLDCMYVIDFNVDGNIYDKVEDVIG